MVSLLDEVDRRMTAGNACGDVRDEDFPALQRQLDDLPSDTGREHARRRSRTASRILHDLVDDQCGEIEAKTGAGDDDDTQTVPTVPTTPTADPAADDTRPRPSRPSRPRPSRRTEPRTEPQTDTEGGGIGPGNARQGNGGNGKETR